MSYIISPLKKINKYSYVCNRINAVLYQTSYKCLKKGT